MSHFADLLGDCPPLLLSLGMAAIVYGIYLTAVGRISDPALCVVLLASGGIVYLGGSFLFMPDIVRSVSSEALKILKPKTL